MKKAYYLFFYKLYQLFKELSDDGWADWKAGLVLQTLQLFVLAIIFIQIDIITKGHTVPNEDPKIWAVPLAIILAIFNYYIFLHQMGWKVYESEFKKYTKQKNMVINLVVFCIVFGVLSILIFTFYQDSQVDWSKYR